MKDHEGRGMTFKVYLKETFVNLIEKLHEMEMEPSQKERLVLNEFIKNGLLAEKEDEVESIMQLDEAVQATAMSRHAIC